MASGLVLSETICLKLVTPRESGDVSDSYTHVQGRGNHGNSPSQTSQAKLYLEKRNGSHPQVGSRPIFQPKEVISFLSLASLIGQGAKALLTLGERQMATLQVGTWTFICLCELNCLVPINPCSQWSGARTR